MKPPFVHVVVHVHVHIYAEAVTFGENVKIHRKEAGSNNEVEPKQSDTRATRSSTKDVIPAKQVQPTRRSLRVSSHRLVGSAKQNSLASGNVEGVL